MFFVLLVVFCSCSCGLNSTSSGEFFAMDTVMSITAYGRGSDEAIKQAEDEIQRLDEMLSVQNQNSEIYLLNKSKSLAVSQDTLELLSKAKSISDKTDGAFDITTQPLSSLWGFYSGEEHRVPQKNEIAEALKNVGKEHIRINKNTVELDENTAVDLGAIAKGYACGAAVKKVKDSGVISALLSLGGNVHAVGAKPDGTDWSIAVADPDDNSKNIGVLAVSDSAVVTSGGYQRFFEENGKIYHHIIDPKTGYPSNSGIKSVTIVCDDDTLADALSTALFVMGLDKASEFYCENSSLFGAVLVTGANGIYVTDNIKNSFSSQRSFEVIKP